LILVHAGSRGGRGKRESLLVKISKGKKAAVHRNARQRSKGSRRERGRAARNRGKKEPLSGKNHISVTQNRCGVREIQKKKKKERRTAKFEGKPSAKQYLNNPKKGTKKIVNQPTVKRGKKKKNAL